MYITDGYENCCIHIFNKKTCKYITTWGICGTNKAEFSSPPHDICINYGSKEDGTEDQIIVADRENYRIQIFNINGSFLKEWNVFRPCGLAIHSFGKKHHKALYIVQFGSSNKLLQYVCPEQLEKWKPNIGNCISIHNIETGKLLHRIDSSVPT